PPSTPVIYTLSLHDALPIRMRTALVFRHAPDRFRRRLGSLAPGGVERDAEIVAERRLRGRVFFVVGQRPLAGDVRRDQGTCGLRDRKSTRLNSSHDQISYAV